MMSQSYLPISVYCRAEAERRYSGKVIRDLELGMLLVEDADGFCHTDEVLRALSFYSQGELPGQPLR